jgi:hypothetical protein
VLGDKKTRKNGGTKKMGLFGKKEKTEATTGATVFFSEEDPAAIRTTLDPKIAEKTYKLEYRGLEESR